MYVYMFIFHVAPLFNCEILIYGSFIPTLMPDEKLARAIRSRKRREILQMLCRKEKMSVHEIADELDMTESSASKHLKLLYDLGLVEFEMKPPEKFYFLKIDEIKEMFEIYNVVAEKMA